MEVNSLYLIVVLFLFSFLASARRVTCLYKCGKGPVKSPKGRGCEPNSAGVLIHTLVTLKFESCDARGVHGLANIRNGPAKRDVGNGVDTLHFLDAQHRMPDLTHQGRRLVRY